jgi:hypothetical protein
VWGSHDRLGEGVGSRLIRLMRVWIRFRVLAQVRFIWVKDMAAGNDYVALVACVINL